MKTARATEAAEGVYVCVCGGGSDRRIRHLLIAHTGTGLPTCAAATIASARPCHTPDLLALLNSTRATFLSSLAARPACASAAAKAACPGLAARSATRPACTSPTANPAARPGGGLAAASPQPAARPACASPAASPDTSPATRPACTRHVPLPLLESTVDAQTFGARCRRDYPQKSRRRSHHRPPPVPSRRAHSRTTSGSVRSVSCPWSCASDSARLASALASGNAADDDEGADATGPAAQACAMAASARSALRAAAASSPPGAPRAVASSTMHRRGASGSDDAAFSRSSAARSAGPRMPAATHACARDNESAAAPAAAETPRQLPAL
eukprot:360583-Chlamydomonas_euryale.AAC.1